MHARNLSVGTLFALAAGLMWGLVFVGPLLLPEYPAALQSFGRYLAFGLIALPLAWFDRGALRQLTRADWIEALKLALVGNIVYYLFLASSIQRAGGPLPTMIIGTLPVVIAITSNLRDARRDGRLPWRQLAPSLLLIAAGIGCVNHAEIGVLRSDPNADLASLCAGRTAGRRRGRMLDLVPDPQRRLAARASRPQPARLGHRSGRGHAAAGAVGLRAVVGLDGGAGRYLCDAVRSATAALRGPDVRDRPVRLLARHAMLERSQPAPADDVGGPADRFRDACRPWPTRSCCAARCPNR